MTTQSNAQDPPAPQPPPAPAGAAPPPAPPAGDAKSITMSAEAFNERVAQAKRSAEADVLKSLGVANADEAKAAIAAKKAADEAKQTEAEKAAKLATDLAAERAKSASLEAAVKARADYELSQLDDAKKAAVSAIAGTDPAAQLKAIEALRPTWAQAPAPTGKAPIPAPASTTGAGAPPKGNDAPVEPTNWAQVYDEVKVKNPMLAASILQAHSADIAAARKQQGGAA